MHETDKIAQMWSSEKNPDNHLNQHVIFNQWNNEQRCIHWAPMS